MDFAVDGPSLSHDTSEREHGHIHGDKDHRNEDSDKENQQGFEQRSHAANGIFEFGGECVGTAMEHLGKTSCLLSHTNQRREAAVVQLRNTGDSFRESTAAFELLGNQFERLSVRIESNDIGKHFHAREQRHAGRREQMEQTTKLSLVVLTDNGARHRQVQQHVR